ncbi:MAG: PilZ domain-containing protein [Desulfatitalea sp.]
MDGVSKVKIILVVAEPGLLKAYIECFKAYDIEIEAVESLVGLEKKLSEDTFNGIIVDLKTKLMAPRDDKELAYEMLEHYPVLQCRILPDSGKLQSMPFGKAKKEVTLDSFMTELCPAFDARKIRSSQRKPIVFNVLLSKNGNFTATEVERTFTVNVSKGGCYIATCQKLSLGDSVAFIIKELSNRAPIVGEIRWQIPWGETMAIPGIGIKFEDIEKGQIKELTEKFRL